MEHTHSRQVDLMNGPIFRNLLIFAIPIFISNLFQQLYNAADTMIVGNILGDTSLAAVGACGSIYELLVGFGLGIGNGLAIVTARAYGAEDYNQVKKTVAGSLVIGLVSSALITLVGMLFLHPLLVALDTPAEIIEEAYSYIRPIAQYVVVMFMYNLCAALLRAVWAKADTRLLDEPFTGLDPVSMEKAAALLNRRCAGGPVLLATHDRAAIEALGWPVLRLDELKGGTGRPLP